MMKHSAQLGLWLVVACGGAAPEPSTPDDPPPVVAVDVPFDEPAANDEDPEDDQPYCSVACQQDGLCAIQDGACVALEDSHCQPSRACKDEGRCSAEEGVCVAGSDSGGDACEQWITLARRCLVNMPPEAQKAMEEAIQSIERLRGQDEATMPALANACEQMIVAFEKTPFCEPTTP
jgi:hypothetical protein